MYMYIYIYKYDKRFENKEALDYALQELGKFSHCCNDVYKEHSKNIRYQPKYFSQPSVNYGIVVNDHE